MHISSTTFHIDAATKEFAQIKGQLALNLEQNTSNLGQILKVLSNHKRLLYNLWVQVAAQSTGALVMSNYMVIELENLGLSGSLPLMLQAVYNTWAAILKFH